MPEKDSLAPGVPALNHCPGCDEYGASHTTPSIEHPAVPAQEAPLEQRLKDALREMQARAEQYSETERVARNGGNNCSMDHASGAKHAYFISARLLRAALEAE
jgi:hypothetical protein